MILALEVPVRTNTAVARSTMPKFELTTEVSGVSERSICVYWLAAHALAVMLMIVETEVLGDVMVEEIRSKVWAFLTRAC